MALCLAHAEPELTARPKLTEFEFKTQNNGRAVSSGSACARHNAIDGAL